jgi:hypothetical protein
LRTASFDQARGVGGQWVWMALGEQMERIGLDGQLYDPLLVFLRNRFHGSV